MIRGSIAYVNLHSDFLNYRPRNRRDRKWRDDQYPNIRLKGYEKRAETLRNTRYAFLTQIHFWFVSLQQRFFGNKDVG